MQNVFTNYNVFTTFVNGFNKRLSTHGRATGLQLRLMGRLAVWILGLKVHTVGIERLVHRILVLAFKNGWSWTVSYLKEAQRLVFQFCGGSPEPYLQHKAGQWVARDHRGLPKIIPGSIRAAMPGNLRLIKGVLTVLGFYRAMWATPVLKMETITAPFSGLSQLLPLAELVRVTTWFPLKPRVAAPSGISHFSASAGPNFRFAQFSAPLDAVSFLYEPFVGLALVRLLSRMGGKKWAIWGLANALLGWPLVALGRLLIRSKHRVVSGRLAELEEAAGKVRVVAITDWWTQVCLKPLHDGLFRVLRTIPQDGTFDQRGPLERLLPLLSTRPAFSFDLSAATDRLPVDLQVQILGLLWGPVEAKLWKTLLVGRFWFTAAWDKVRYAVGQPMGAYSSWAMLAITHHFVVQIAASRVGWNSWFPYYAVLGDDVVIADRAVAESYKALMRDLGVGISDAKSLVSEKGVCEFAKKLVGPEGDYSPLGAGVLLACARSPLNLPLLFRDALDKGLWFSPHASRELLLDARHGMNFSARTFEVVLWALVGLNGILWTDPARPLTGILPLDQKRGLPTSQSALLTAHWVERERTGLKRAEENGSAYYGFITSWYNFNLFPAPKGMGGWGEFASWYTVTLMPFPRPALAWFISACLLFSSPAWWTCAIRLRELQEQSDWFSVMYEVPDQTDPNQWLLENENWMGPKPSVPAIFSMTEDQERRAQLQSLRRVLSTYHGVLLGRIAPPMQATDVCGPPLASTAPSEELGPSWSPLLPSMLPPEGLPALTATHAPEVEGVETDPFPVWRVNSGWKPWKTSVPAVYVPEWPTPTV